MLLQDPMLPPITALTTAHGNVSPSRGVHVISLARHCARSTGQVPSECFLYESTTGAQGPFPQEVRPHPHHKLESKPLLFPPSQPRRPVPVLSPHGQAASA